MPRKKSDTKRAPTTPERLSALEGAVDEVEVSIHDHYIGIDNGKDRLDAVEEHLEEQGPVLAGFTRAYQSLSDKLVGLKHRQNGQDSLIGALELESERRKPFISNLLDNVAGITGKITDIGRQLVNHTSQLNYQEKRVRALEDETALKGKGTLASRLHRVEVQAEQDRTCNSKRRSTHSKDIRELNERMDEWQRTPLKEDVNRNTHHASRRAARAHTCVVCSKTIDKGTQYHDTWEIKGAPGRRISLSNHTRYHNKCHSTLINVDYSALEARILAHLQDETQGHAKAHEALITDLSERLTTENADLRRTLDYHLGVMKPVVINTHDEVAFECTCQACLQSLCPKKATKVIRDWILAVILAAAIVLSFIGGFHLCQSSHAVTPAAITVPL